MAILGEELSPFGAEIGAPDTRGEEFYIVKIFGSKFPAICIGRKRDQDSPDIDVEESSTIKCFS